jgi:hypothetical protein
MNSPYSRQELAFSEGKAAYAEGERRGSNPYSASGTQKACLAWWAGWDEAWDEAHAVEVDQESSSVGDDQLSLFGE